VLEWFKCPNGKVTTVKECLSKCQMGERCLTLPTLTLMAQEREWTGVPSTTQLLNGTMYEFLKLTQPYVVDPDSRAFMLAGTKHHQSLEEFATKLGLPAEKALNIDRDIFDLLEPDNDWYVVNINVNNQVIREIGELEPGAATPLAYNEELQHKWTLTDYKLWGSYRVALALGIVKIGQKPDPSEAVYKVSGKWGQAGTPKMVSVFESMPQEADVFNEELQLNRYRIMLEELGIAISKMQLQVTVRDGGLAVAHSRGVARNIYRIPIQRLDNDYVAGYFQGKELHLQQALKVGVCNEPCNDHECWYGARCRGYCEVARYCPKGILYTQVPASG